MKAIFPQLNLLLAWLWILLGFASGMVMGMFFHRENWLGGYNSLQRRMYRLAHISFFGLGTVNLLFWLTISRVPMSEASANLAALGFAFGAVTMPVCCVLMAHWPKVRMLFSVPVLSLITAGVVTLLSLKNQLSILDPP